MCLQAGLKPGMYLDSVSIPVDAHVLGYEAITIDTYIRSIVSLTADRELAL